MSSADFPTAGLRFNPTLAGLPVYQPGRPIEEVARELRLPFHEVVKLASNENPLGPSPRVIEALRGQLEHVHLYPDGNAFYLKNALARQLRVQPENLILGNGSNEVLELVGHALVSPGTEVVVSEYCFAVYPIVTLLFGGRPVVVPARDYGHDLPTMGKAITGDTRVVFVANPNNPTGTLASGDEVRRLVEALPPNVLGVFDEAYLEYQDDPVDLLPHIRAGEKPNLLLTRTFSKIHGLAGLRIGYGIGHPDLIAALEKVREPFNVNSLAQSAALAALEDPEHVRRTREANRAGLLQLSAACRELALPCLPSAANFILVRVGNGEQLFAELQKHGVIVRPMGGYRLPEWVRISIGTSEQNVRCIDTLKKVRR